MQIGSSDKARRNLIKKAENNSRYFDVYAVDEASRPSNMSAICTSDGGNKRRGIIP